MTITRGNVAQSLKPPLTQTVGERGSPFDAIVGESAAVQQATALARRLATSPVRCVLLTGEAGTGKELLARCIHNSSPNASAPFVAINCAAMPAALVEVELFGQEMAQPGATGGSGGPAKRGVLELVGSGTVLLKDIGELASSLQVRLQRVIEVGHVRRLGAVEEVPVQCRIIVTSKLKLEERVAAGSFSAELLARLSMLRIDLPPLRERDDDSRLIADHLLAEIARAHGSPRKHLGIDASEVLRAHRWPGNIRELRYVLERAITLSDGGLITAAHMLIQQRRSLAGPQQPSAYTEIRVPHSGKRLRDIEREALEITLQITNYNQSAAARLLGISRPTLARKLRAYGLVNDAMGSAAS
jgi:transcriptional regulator with PAS, ATPase and Fis domain